MNSYFGKKKYNREVQWDGAGCALDYHRDPHLGFERFLTIWVWQLVYVDNEEY